MKKTTGIVLVLASSFCLHAQEMHLPDLSFYADIMVHASMPEHRIRAAAEFHGLMTNYLNTPESLSNTLSDLPWVTVATPQDSLFRIITWQVEESQTFKYYGFIQFLRTHELRLQELSDVRSVNSEYTTYGPDTWYGALYYGIQPFKTADDVDAYLILGFNAHTRELNQRIGDVVSIKETALTFGLPVFFINDSTETKSRIILDYADASSATMRFDRENELLIYDHVISINTPEGPTLVPDGSYHGFQYKKGMWYYIDSVFNVKVDQPPGGRQKESVKRDLFGREMDRKN